MKKNLVILAAVLILGLSVLAGCGGNKEQSQQPPQPPQTQFISIATASIGGSYYPIGVGMAEIFNREIANVDAKVEVTGGATENPKLVGSGDSDLGLTNANLAFAAYEGLGLFEGSRYENLRIMFAGVAPGTFHIAVREDSDIYTYADLKGKKVAVGPQGGGGLGMLPHIFELFDMTMDDIQPNYASFDEGVQALVDKHVEAALVQAPHPAPAIKTLEGTRIGFRLIELTDAERDALLVAHPYYNKVDVPVETYGLPAIAKTVGSTNVVVINAELSEELVYEMTKILFESLDELQAVHPSAKSIKVETAVSDLIPMHPGAERYFKEVGALK